MQKILIVLVMLFFQACQEDSGEDTNINETINTSSLEVVSHTPEASAVSVSPDLTQIIVNFNKTLDLNTITSENVILSNNILTTLSSSANVLSIHLNEPLQRGINYTLSLANIKSSDGSNLSTTYHFDFRTCAQTSTATYELQWDEVLDTDLKNYTLYYGKNSPLTQANALGQINISSSSFEFTPSSYGILPCETFYVSLSAVGNIKAESLLALELSQEAE